MLNGYSRVAARLQEQVIETDGDFAAEYSEDHVRRSIVHRRAPFDKQIAKLLSDLQLEALGQVAEWLKARAWRA